MDRIETYRNILQTVVKRHAKFQPANGRIETFAVCDRENDDYMVTDVGWDDKGRRIHDIVIHFRLRGEKVIVERDATDADVVGELLENGIGQDDIVIAFNPNGYQKLPDLIAA